MKRWEPPRRQGFCGPQAQLWATCDFVTLFEVLETPSDGTVYVASTSHFQAIADFVPYSKAWRTRQKAGVM